MELDTPKSKGCKGKLAAERTTVKVSQILERPRAAKGQDRRSGPTDNFMAGLARHGLLMELGGQGADGVRDHSFSQDKPIKAGHCVATDRKQSSGQRNVGKLVFSGRKDADESAGKGEADSNKRCQASCENFDRSVKRAKLELKEPKVPERAIPAFPSPALDSITQPQVISILSSPPRAAAAASVTPSGAPSGPESPLMPLDCNLQDAAAAVLHFSTLATPSTCRRPSVPDFCEPGSRESESTQTSEQMAASPVLANSAKDTGLDSAGVRLFDMTVGAPAFGRAGLEQKQRSAEAVDDAVNATRMSCGVPQPQSKSMQHLREGEKSGTRDDSRSWTANTQPPVWPSCTDAAAVRAPSRFAERHDATSGTCSAHLQAHLRLPGPVGVVDGSGTRLSDSIGGEIQRGTRCDGGNREMILKAWQTGWHRIGDIPSSFAERDGPYRAGYHNAGGSAQEEDGAWRQHGVFKVGCEKGLTSTPGNR
jgi:hypothetical protein